MFKYIPLSFIFFFMLSNFSFAALKVDCIDGKIKYLSRSTIVTTEERYCYDSSQGSIVSLKKCSNNKDCLASFEGPYLLKRKDVHSEVGSPGFKVCELLNGIPQFIEFWDSENWIKTSRCIFKDGAYVDIGALLLKVKYVD